MIDRNFKTFKIDALSEIRNMGIVTNGQVFWVSSTSDSDHRDRTDQLGRKVVKTSLQAAINDANTDQNDHILVIPTDGGTVRTLGTAVDVNKNRLHILGVGARSGHMVTNGLAFDGFAVAVGNDTELVMVTGAGVEMGGLKFVGTSGTHATGTITATFRAGTASTGTAHDLWLHDMTIENTNAAAAGGTAPIFEMTGDVATGIQGLRVERSWIGNRAWAATPVVNLAGTAGPTRAEFRDTMFVMDAQATSDRFVAGGTGATHYMLFKNCEFLNVESGTLPASAYTGIALADNPVLLRDCVLTNVTQAGSGAEVYKAPAFSGTAAAITDIGIAIGSAAILPA